MRGKIRNKTDFSPILVIYNHYKKRFSVTLKAAVENGKINPVEFNK